MGFETQACQHGKIEGHCHCQAVKVIAQIAEDPEKIQPRACDCSFCVRQGASYFSDSQGQLEFQIEDGLRLLTYRQGPAGLVDFLFCPKCFVLLGACYQENEAKYCALNAPIFGLENFASAVSVSPQNLTAEEKSLAGKKSGFPESVFRSDLPRSYPR